MDPVTSDRISLLHPAIGTEVYELISLADGLISKAITIRIVQGLRTFEEQDNLFAQGRTRPGKIITQAKAGQSFHNYGLAFDFCFLVNGKELNWDTEKDFDGDQIPDWFEVVKVFEKEGYEWGGEWKFKDYPHLQKTFSHTWKDLLEKHNKQDFIKGTHFVNL